MNYRPHIGLSVLLCLTLGLAPFKPEPHLFGKIKWILGGGDGMALMDYLDLFMHALPFLALIFFVLKELRRKSEDAKKGAETN